MAISKISDAQFRAWLAKPPATETWSTPSLDPELFDLPGDRRPRRIFLASGEKRKRGPDGKPLRGKKAFTSNYTYINAPTRLIAERTGKRYLGKLGYKFTHLVELTWAEYARVLDHAARGCGGSCK